MPNDEEKQYKFISSLIIWYFLLLLLPSIRLSSFHVTWCMFDFQIGAPYMSVEKGKPKKGGNI
jgi:hypothetical protein